MCLFGFLILDYFIIVVFVFKLGKVIEDLFVQIVMECDYLGFIGGNSFFIDGIKLFFNVSKEQFGIFVDFECKYKKC